MKVLAHMHTRLSFPPTKKSLGSRLNLVMRRRMCIVQALHVGEVWGTHAYTQNLEALHMRKYIARVHF